TVAISFSADESPPRVKSRRQWTPIPASNNASTAGHTATVSLFTSPSNSRPSRTDRTAIPCEPRSPLTMTTSPGHTDCGPTVEGATTTPTPLVLMNNPSPLPLSSTFVSPVTMETSALSAASRIEATIVFNVSSDNPSSNTNPAVNPIGRAPH